MENIAYRYPFVQHIGLD